MSDDLPAPDQVPGAPHPRETANLFGQNAASEAFLGAHRAGRLHHGWLLCGPKGVGKATLAWRIARFLLAEPAADAPGLFGESEAPATLEVSPDHPVARRIAAGSEPRLAAVTRTVNPDTGRMRTEITAGDVRRLNRFFGLSAADGGHRVVIIDSADEMNATAANALLKMLEEPPAKTTLLLVAHRPDALLPTIRSRCRTLRLAPLGPADLARALEAAGAEPAAEGGAEHLSALAAGSVGEALRLMNLGGLALYGEVIEVLASLPKLDRTKARKLAETGAGRGAADRFDLLLDLIDLALARLARTGAAGAPPVPEAAGGEAQVLQRLSPDPKAGRAWAVAAAEVSRRTRQGRAVNLDPAALVLDTVFRIQETAGDCAPPRRP